MVFSWHINYNIMYLTAWTVEILASGWCLQDAIPPWTAAGLRGHYSLWSEVVVCTVWGSVILPHTGANCTNDCLAHGWVNSSGCQLLSCCCWSCFRIRNTMYDLVILLLFLKILSGTCRFMTTNTSATFLGITKGERYVGLSVPWFDVELEVTVVSFFLLFVSIFLVTRVTSLSMSPVDDTFISGSLDKTIRLWDLRSPNCQVRTFLL